MGKRDLSLTPRIEDKRDKKAVLPPVHFRLPEIKQHFDESMQTIKGQYIVADNLLSEGKIDACKTIWRSQVVFAESLLDFFIHEMSKYCLFRMFTGEWQKSEQYKNLDVKMSKVEEGLAFKESNEWFFEYLNEKYTREVFLSGDSMRDQLNLIGIGFESAMRKVYLDAPNKDFVKYCRREVEKLFDRRNKIAHQNDRDHFSAAQTNITKEFVEQYISDIEAIVNAIHDIAKEKDEALSPA